MKKPKLLNESQTNVSICDDVIKDKGEGSSGGHGLTGRKIKLVFFSFCPFPRCYHPNYVDFCLSFSFSFCLPFSVPADKRGKNWIMRGDNQITERIVPGLTLRVLNADNTSSYPVSTYRKRNKQS
jgi:hypothetical protein